MISTLLMVLLEAALRALLAALVLGLGLRVLRVKNVPAQKTVWGVVLGAALAMPLLMRWQWLPAWAEIKLPTPAWLKDTHTAPQPAQVSAPPLAVASSQQAQIKTDRYPAPAISMTEFDEPSASANEAAAESPAAHTPLSAAPESAPAKDRRFIRMAAIGWLLYLGVCATLLFRLFFGLGSSLRLWSEAETVELAPKFGLPRGIRVRSSHCVTSPVNIGSGILLPADYRHWSEEKLRIVLAHEGSHVLQRDFYLQFLARLYSGLTWFSPLGWWLKRKLCELGEAISDRAGLEAADSPSAYAQLLLEFAALPRPSLTGVSMAHSANLSERIERLLNDSTFRQAFAGSRRALLALALVPVVLVAAVALVHVQAAEAYTPQAVAQPAAMQTSDQVPAQAATTGQSHPNEAQVTDQDAAPQPKPAPVAVPVPPAPDTVQAPPAPPAPPAAGSDVAPVAPVPPSIDIHTPSQIDIRIPPMPDFSAAMAQVNAETAEHLRDFLRDDGGEPYALVGDPGTKAHFFGNWHDDRDAEIDKARKIAHGHFLWFRHDGKSYIIDDPAIVSQIETMQKPMQDLHAQMKELGEQMRAAGEQAREQARKEREESRNITVPDLSKEMADLNAAMADLQAKQGSTISREQLAEIERRLGEVQRKLMTAQFKNVNWQRDMGEFGKVQGEYGEKMGKLGAQMGQLAQENNEKIKSIIDESLKNGKARPVE